MSMGQTWRLWHGQSRTISIICHYKNSLANKNTATNRRFFYPQVKARGTRIPEVWYSSPYCTPEAEIARGNEDSWSSTNDENGNFQEDEDKKKTKKQRVWASVEPSTDNWALGILTYAMLTGSHPWAETASDCCSYVKYRDWFESAEGPDDELDVWVEPDTESTQGATDLNGNRQKDGSPVAPQFACFTQLACSFFQSLLDPRPQLRGSPEDALSYLGDHWMMEKERMRQEKERKKNSGKTAIKSVKEMEGRGER